MNPLSDHGIEALEDHINRLDDNPVYDSEELSMITNDIESTFYDYDDDFSYMEEGFY